MLEYETLRLIWWLLLGVLLIGFAVMDGFDLGIAAAFRFIAKTPQERNLMLASIEPVWEGNQVWLVLGLGAVFAAWPALYAAVFSGFYPLVFILLVCLILRPVGFSFREKVAHQWTAAWDWSLCVGATVITLVFGILFGNLMLGVPFYFDDLLRVHFDVGLMDLFSPFALLCGLVSLVMLLMHGAVYAALKLESSLQQRSVRLGQICALALTGTFLLGGFWLSQLDGQVIISSIAGDGPSNPTAKLVAVKEAAWLNNYQLYPWMWLAPVIGLVMPLLTAVLLRAGRMMLAFITSASAVAAVIVSAGLALFPFLLPSSSHPDHSLVVWDASSSQTTLFVMLIAVCLFMPLILSYTAWVFRVLRGKVTALEH